MKAERYRYCLYLVFSENRWRHLDLLFANIGDCAAGSWLHVRRNRIDMHVIATLH